MPFRFKNEMNEVVDFEIIRKFNFTKPGTMAYNHEYPRHQSLSILKSMNWIKLELECNILPKPKNEQRAPNRLFKKNQWNFKKEKQKQQNLQDDWSKSNTKIQLPISSFSKINTISYSCSISTKLIYLP